MRYACLRVPDLPVAVARRDDRILENRPVVIVGGPARAHEQISFCSSEARRAGIEPGITLRQALARCPDAVYLPWHTQTIVAAHAGLHTLLRDFSAAIEVISPGHFHFDISGMPDLAGLTPEEWAADLFEALRRGSGLSLRVACAEGLFLAHAAASVPRLPGIDLHAAPEPPGGMLAFVPAGLHRKVLDALPVEALPIEPDMIRRLSYLGLLRLGQVASLPLGALQAQLGPAGARMWRLSRGHEDLMLLPEGDELLLEAELALPAPLVSIRPLMHATRTLLERLLGRPEVSGRLVRQSVWIANLEGGEQLECTVTFRSPTADGARMAAAMQAKIERLPFTAPVIELRVALSGVCGEYGQQGQLWLTGPRNRTQLLDEVAQLTTRCGGPQVWRIVEVEPWSRIPERQLGLVPFGVR